MLRHANRSARWNGKSRFMFHSSRNASIGSILLALRAGSQQAIKPAVANKSATPISVAGVPVQHPPSESEIW